MEEIVPTVGVIHPGPAGEERREVRFLGRRSTLVRRGCGGSAEEARRLVAALDGSVVALALEGLPIDLELGPARRPHRAGSLLPAAARTTPVVDGGGARPGLERWAVARLERTAPSLIARRRVLMVPGLQHGGLAHALAHRGCEVRWADPVVFFGLPEVPGVGTGPTLGPAAGPTLARLEDAPFERLRPRPGDDDRQGHDPSAFGSLFGSLFSWADVLAGDAGAILATAPRDLRGKTILVDHLDPVHGEADLEALERRGAARVITLLPPVEELGTDGGGGDDAVAHRSGRRGGIDPEQAPLARHGAATLEALLVALRDDPQAPLDRGTSEDTYLPLLARLDWTPALRTLRPELRGVSRFAFVIHPLDVSFIHRDPRFRWTRFLPDRLVEAVAARLPPLPVSKITGAVSPTTGQRVEGFLITLGATPRQMLARRPRAVYDQLHRVAAMAERRGARILGLGAFTSVVGDAGETVAHEADIAVTSGNSLTVAATLEAARRAVERMGLAELGRSSAMVVGATGSIGSVCARLLARDVAELVLVSIEPERLIELQRSIAADTPGVRLTIATSASEHLERCDLVVTATSAFGQRVVDLSRVRPGAVICDVARPPDISEDEAALRPDVLIIEGGEVIIPGEVDFGYDIGLPPRVSYACLAETALLAMEGRFEDFTLGRRIEVERVEEIHRLFVKHGFELDALRSFGRVVEDQELADKRRLAEELRRDPRRFERMRNAAAEAITALPPRAKGVVGRGAASGGSAAAGASPSRPALAGGTVGRGLAGLALLAAAGLVAGLLVGGARDRGGPAERER